MFQRAIALLDGALTKYGSDRGLAPSTGRKPRKTDISQFSEIYRILKAVWESDVNKTGVRRAQLEKQGYKTLDHHFKPVDHGIFFLGDCLPISASDTHFFQLLGFWRLGFVTFLRTQPGFRKFKRDLVICRGRNAERSSSVRKFRLRR